MLFALLAPYSKFCKGGLMMKNLPKNVVKIKIEIIYCCFSLLHRGCCFNYLFNIPTHAHTIYTLKALKFTLKTFVMELCSLRPYLITVRRCMCVSGVTYWTLSFHSVSNTRHTHIQTDCNDIRPQTAQFYNERISTDLSLVT